jgi:hypothetical protein
MVRWALVSPRLRVTEEAHPGGTLYGVQRRNRSRWGYSRLYESLDAAIRYAERLLEHEGQGRTAAARAARRLAPGEATSTDKLTGPREVVEWWHALSARERGRIAAIYYRQAVAAQTIRDETGEHRLEIGAGG